MSGQGKRFQAAGYKDPKPLVSINGKPIIERLMQSFPASWRTTFVLSEDHADTKLPSVLRSLRPEALQIQIPKHDLGPGHALILAMDSLDPDLPVLVSYCDYGMVWDSSDFQRFVGASECDICVVSYRGFHPHYLSKTTYAYSRMEGERVVEVKEKGSFTSNRENEFASCGLYYFRNVKILRQALDFQIAQNLTLNGEFYTSLTVQAFIKNTSAANVRVYEIPRFFQWGTPEDLRRFEFWERTFHAHLSSVGRAGSVGAVVLPMAGKGSRFLDLTQTPKPLINVNGQKMFEAALSTLPDAKETVIVATEQIAKQIDATSGKRQIVRLSSTPPGQAYSTLSGTEKLDPDLDVMVSACDHGIAMLPSQWSKWHEIANSGKYDACVFTMQPFPPAIEHPQAYSYIENTDKTLDIKRVFLKSPVPDTPMPEQKVLVGTFWFRKAGILCNYIRKLETLGLAHNGELFLDSVINVFLDEGCRVFSFPLDGYLCWGEPDVLSEALYWQEVFCAVQYPPRPRFPGVV
jgi:NDP-sugar pyrophosphorylase family protein